MNPTLLLALGLGAGALYLYTRNNATRTVTYTTASGTTVTVQAPTASSSQVQSVIAQQREIMIQRIMQRDHLTREQAEARYNQLMPAVATALQSGGPVSGLGNYCWA